MMTGAELREIRATLRMSQGDFGRKVGMLQPNISDYETGRKKISAEVEALIRHVFAGGKLGKFEPPRFKSAAPPKPRRKVPLCGRCLCWVEPRLPCGCPSMKPTMTQTCGA